MADFEEKLAKLEQLTQNIKRTDISLEDALKDFEEGIKLARGMESEIDKIEGKIQQLMNQPDPANGIAPQTELFSNVNESGTAGTPVQGTRQ